MAPTDLGTLAWAERTGGRLSARERRQLLSVVLRQSVRYTVRRLAAAAGWHPARRADLDLATLAWPDSRLARVAEDEAAARLSAAVVHHSQRTFVFGLALARLDARTVDVEELYVTSLLHDVALEASQEPGCFAVRGADLTREFANRAGCAPDVAQRLAEGVCMHITPGIDYTHGALAPLVQVGAMVDLVGDRLWDLDPDLVARTIARFPRLDVQDRLAASWRAHARAMPEGRAAFLERMTRFSLLVRLAPFRG